MVRDEREVRIRLERESFSVLLLEFTVALFKVKQPLTEKLIKREELKRNDWTRFDNETVPRDWRFNFIRLTIRRT